MLKGGVFMAMLALWIILIAWAGGANAQSMLQVPGPGSQQQPKFSPPPASNTPPDYGSTEELPQAQSTPPPAPPIFVPPPQAAAPPPPPAPAPSIAVRPPEPQMNPVLPAVFHGCWEGAVEQLDRIERLPRAHRVGYWTTKTYRLCYRRVGDGPFKLTFTQTGVMPNERIVRPRGKVDPIATDGRAWAKMRSILHFDEIPPESQPDATMFSVDEVTTLDCHIDSNQMMVSADVYGTRDGEPWFRARWHADFRHVPQ